MSDRAQAQAKVTPAQSAGTMSTGLLQRKCACGGAAGLSGECAECGKKQLAIQRKPANQAAPFDVPPIVYEVLRSPGQPLDIPTRAFFEPRFGHDFSHVRVHTDAKAAESAQAVNALAYTFGDDIVFASGQYSPKDTKGQCLLAHELTHNIQQQQAKQETTSPLEISNPLEELDAQADRIAQMALVAPPFSHPPLSAALQQIPQASAQVARKADPAAVAKLDPPTIMKHPDYIENNLTRMEFLFAEKAVLHYADGASLTIGLIPMWIKPPMESVDYHSASSQYVTVTGSSSVPELKFIREPQKLPTEGMRFREVIKKFAIPVKFTVDPQSGKIVPNHLNPVTSPYLCSWLRRVETEYVKNFDLMAKGMVEALTVMKHVVELQLLRVSLVGPKAAKSPKVPVKGAAGAAGSATVENAIIAEVRGILSSTQMAQLRAAYATGKSITIRIGSRVIQYEPGSKFSGMTMFGENGFVLGSEAFSSEAELTKTLLQELYRLTTSSIGRGAGAQAQTVAAETNSAFEFAEWAYKVMFGKTK